MKMDSAMYLRYSLMETWDECIDHLYLTKDFADFRIIVGSGVKQMSFQVHKFILRISSPKFDEMIRDSQATPNSSITILDAEPKDVEIMLSHIYKRKFVLSSTREALNVLSLATRYKLLMLKENCTNYLESVIDAENACFIYQQSISLENEDLLYKSFKFIQKAASKVLEKTDLTDIYPSVLNDILKQDYLNIDSELQLLERLIDWSKKQLKIQRRTETPEQLRRVLNPFLKYIRFLCISQETFARIQIETKIFTEEELGKILMRFTTDKWLDVPAWFNQNTTTRRYKPDIKPKSISLVNWFNISNDVYTHSELVKSITSEFVAKANAFVIRRFAISICDKCLHRNTVSGRQIIHSKIGIKTKNISREAPCEIPILSGNFDPSHSEPLSLDKCEPIILTKYFDKDKIVYRQYLGMDAPIIKSYFDPEPSSLSSFVEPPRLSKTVEVLPPVYVKGGETFSLSVEINESNSLFYCCRKKPSFDDAPFAVYNDDEKEMKNCMQVWCAFASVDYFLTGNETLPHE